LRVSRQIADERIDHRGGILLGALIMESLLEESKSRVHRVLHAPEEASEIGGKSRATAHAVFQALFLDVLPRLFLES